MENMLSVKEMAARWKLSTRQIRKMCQEGRVPGAVKQGRAWLIPDSVERLPDGFNGNGRICVERRLLPFPVGLSDFCRVAAEFYYVDKTLLIRDVLDGHTKVTLFTRPRRFGKTLALDMLRTFFEMCDEDNSRYFIDKKIWACGERYRQHQGAYPVVFLSFKSVMYDSWEYSLMRIRRVLRDEFFRLKKVLDCDKCSDVDKAAYRRVIDGTASDTEIANSLALVTRMLDECYGKAPVVFVDEYDTPIYEGYRHGFLEEVLTFIRKLFSGAFAANQHLSYGLLAGILCVAEGSIFNVLDNREMCSVLESKYSEYFGFTPDEVREMTLYYGVPEKYDEICKWYNGYTIGEQVIYNPWSIANYFNINCEPMPFWVETGSSDFIREMFTPGDGDIMDALACLLQGGSIQTAVDTGVIYPQTQSSPSSKYSLLLIAGYLTAEKGRTLESGEEVYSLRIPNREIAGRYRREILRKFRPMISSTAELKIWEAINQKSAQGLKDALHNVLLCSADIDKSVENIPNCLMLGLCAMMPEYSVASSPEDGENTHRLCLTPLLPDIPGIVIEIKIEPGADAVQLQNAAQTALRRAEEQQCIVQDVNRSTHSVICFGVVVSENGAAVIDVCNRLDEV